MKSSAGIAAALAGLFSICGAQAESPTASQVVAGMYAEAISISVSAEEAEQALRSTVALRTRQDVVAGLDGIVGSWTNAAAGASAAPARAQLRR